MAAVSATVSFPAGTTCARPPRRRLYDHVKTQKCFAGSGAGQGVTRQHLTRTRASEPGMSAVTVRAAGASSSSAEEGERRRAPAAVAAAAAAIVASSAVPMQALR